MEAFKLAIRIRSSDYTCDDVQTIYKIVEWRQDQFLGLISLPGVVDIFIQ